MPDAESIVLRELGQVQPKHANQREDDAPSTHHHHSFDTHSSFEGRWTMRAIMSLPSNLRALFRFKTHASEDLQALLDDSDSDSDSTRRSHEGNDELEMELFNLSSEDERKLLRKIDVHLMPLMFISYMLQFLDKGALGHAAIFTLKNDNHLVGQQYSWCSSAFYCGYLVASYPVSLGFVKFPLGKYLATAVCIWAVILACHGAASSFASLFALRFLLGIFESMISPGFSLITSIWYKPSEHVTRHAIWFCGNNVAGVFGAILSFGIGHIESGISPWRWIFIIYGSITFIWSFILLIFLPDSPRKAKFLEPRERSIAHVRPQKTIRSFKTGQWKKSQFIEAFLDPKTWLLFFYTGCSSLSNGGISAFSSIIIKGIVHDTFQSLLLGIPASVVQIFILILSTYLASKFRRSRCLVMSFVLCVAVFGWCLVAYLPDENHAGRLIGTFLFASHSNGFPLSLSIIASDVAGFTKKTTVAALLFLGYCAGNIAGPQVFLSRESPRYKTGCEVCIISLCFSILCVLGLRQYMDFENRRRDREQGVVIDAEATVTENLNLRVQQVDETDWENKAFRYIL